MRVVEFTADLERGVADYVVLLGSDRGRLIRYSLVLRVQHGGEWEVVRSYDNVHGRHDMHRHTLDEGKQPAETSIFGTPSEAYNAARRSVRSAYKEMIAGWLR